MDKETFQEMLQHLHTLGEAGRGIAAYLADHKVRIGFRKQNPATGAYWWPDGNIYLNPLYYPPGMAASNPEMLSLIVHEARHLQQGLLTALSVYGEMEAWQLGFGLLRELTGWPLPSAVVRLLALPLGWDREILRQARSLMREHGGKKYRIDLLPLYPLHLEILYRLTGRVPPIREHSETLV